MLFVVKRGGENGEVFVFRHRKRLYVCRFSHVWDELGCLVQRYGEDFLPFGYVRLFKRLTVNEYRIVVFFLWLPSADMAVSRVTARVRQGGHNVPEPVVRRRYDSGLLNSLSLYRPLAHIFRIYDASHLLPKIVAHEEKGEIEVFDTAIFEKMTKNIRV